MWTPEHDPNSVFQQPVSAMDEIEQLIQAKALVRLSGIFKMPVAALIPRRRFGDDLKASFVSDFRHNEFDQVNDDIHDVADRTIAKEFGSRNLTIKTVEDCCDHMVKCGKTKRKDVVMLLGIDQA